MLTAPKISQRRVFKKCLLARAKNRTVMSDAPTCVSSTPCRLKRTCTYKSHARLESCSRDPIGYVGSKWNLYGYVRNAPLSLSDPSGLDPGYFDDWLSGYWYFLSGGEAPADPWILNNGSEIGFGVAIGAGIAAGGLAGAGAVGITEIGIVPITAIPQTAATELWTIWILAGGGGTAATQGPRPGITAPPPPLIGPGNDGCKLGGYFMPPYNFPPSIN